MIMLDFAFEVPEVMRISFSSMGLLLVFFVSPLASLGQQQKATSPLERTPIDWFYEDANYHSNTLLLKSLQFTAPYPGFYQQLSLDTNGNAFTGQIVPNWAIQASQTAKLDVPRLDEIRRTLIGLTLGLGLTLGSSLSLPEPQPGQLHTAFIFYDGKAYLRYDFNGVLPPQVAAILETIRKELDNDAKVRLEQFMAHHKLMEETYGDWQNKSGVAVVGGGRMHVFKETPGLLLTLMGQRKTLPTAAITTVSIYNVLVFYPNATVTGSGSGGSWSDDPLSSEVVIWILPSESGSYAADTSERKLEIKYNAIEATVSVGGKTYQLSHGNMFIIRMGENWMPTVNQLEVNLDEQTTEQNVLDRFKSILRNDAFIQRLELN